ncbi:hypothetical protein PAXINDRAFT_158858 [Paxillus involutus ATCC 200175]|uniref:Uncharacterized protein n=1 Tax=Paxillus involutus ATCC 200175 TaxID=664439 RepID=A0A0C9TFK4_PAXIN|nr:hypothetical protein PAXINDRAFT_158858 [Paxillus involutus ATCC 200175]
MNVEVAKHTSRNENAADGEIKPSPRRPNEASASDKLLDRSEIPALSDPSLSDFKQDTPPDTPSRDEDPKDENESKWPALIGEVMRIIRAKSNKDPKDEDPKDEDPKDEDPKAEDPKDEDPKDENESKLGGKSLVQRVLGMARSQELMLNQFILAQAANPDQDRHATDTSAHGSDQPEETER